MKTLRYARATHALSAAAFALLVLAAPAVHAQINKCYDGRGKVVAYGSECPAGTRSEATNIGNSPRTPAPDAAARQPATKRASGPKSIAEQEAEFRKRQAEKQEAQAKADKEAAAKQARARACDSAQSYLKSLQSGMRIVRTDPKTGERVVFTDADYARETASAQRAVDANCK